MASAVEDEGPIEANGHIPTVEESIKDVLACAKAFIGHAETVPGADVALLEKMMAMLAKALFSTNNIARDALQKVQAWETSLRQREDNLARCTNALRKKEEQLATQENGTSVRLEKDEALTPLAGSAPDGNLFSRPQAASPDLVRQSSERYSPPMEDLDGEPRLFAPRVVQRVCSSSAEVVGTEEVLTPATPAVAASPGPRGNAGGGRTPKKTATFTLPSARSISAVREGSSGRLTTSRSVTAMASPKPRVGRSAVLPPQHGTRPSALRSTSASAHPPTTRHIRRETSLTSSASGALAPKKRAPRLPRGYNNPNVGKGPHHSKRASPGRPDDHRTAEALTDVPAKVPAAETTG